MRAKAGDRRALDDFVRATSREVKSLCRYLGHPVDPDDLTQETYERALASLHRFRGDGPARSWLLSIARRVCADSTRRMVRSRRLHDRLVVQPTEQEIRDTSWLEIHDLLAGLDPDRAEAFVLTQLMGMSYEDAAAVAGCPIGTIRSRVARARRQLLDDDGVDAALGA